LRVYLVAQQIEDAGIALAIKLPASEAYALATSLRRSVSGIAHHIYDSHRRYSYTVKLDALHAAVAEAEQTKKLLTEYTKSGYGKADELSELVTSLIQQCWGLIKYIRSRQSQYQLQTQSNAKASDELVAARA